MENGPGGLDEFVSGKAMLPLSSACSTTTRSDSDSSNAIWFEQGRQLLPRWKGCCEYTVTPEAFAAPEAWAASAAWTMVPNEQSMVVNGEGLSLHR